MQNLIFPVNNTNTDEAANQLQEVSKEVFSILKEEYQGKYVVTRDVISKLKDDDEFVVQYRVREGSNVGVSTELHWSKSSSNGNLEISITKSTKMETNVMMWSMYAFALITGYFAYADFSILAFLPGRKIAFFLGVLIGVIPGAIIGAILKKLVKGNSSQVNTELITKVKESVLSISGMKQA